MKYIMAYDLGTGGNKVAIYNSDGEVLGDRFAAYKTFFLQKDFQEQRPKDWWSSIVESTKMLLEKTNISPEDIVGLALSGHSLGVVPIDKNGELLADLVPLWCDTRAGEESKEFFNKIDEKTWYETTGNGFPPHLYSIFKIMWYKKHQKEMYDKTDCFLGTKDYINYILTGVAVTDHSYASGCGAYSLNNRDYIDEYLYAAEIDKAKMPKIVESTYVLGTILPEIAKELGLSPTTKVCSGGVDNSCMALGAARIEKGDALTCLGTSSWTSVTDDKPVVNNEKRSYVFAHCVPNLYVSATSIFSGGGSLRWVRDTLCQDFIKEEEETGKSSYYLIDKLAEKSPVGSKGLIFNPSLAGGSSLDESPYIKGCFTGLELRHDRADILRSTLEGVCMNLKMALNILEESANVSDEILTVGGGANSPLWSQMFADIYEKTIVIGNIGQNAGSLGAASIAAVGCGLWEDFSPLKTINKQILKYEPIEENMIVYRRLLKVFEKVAVMQCEIGDMLNEI